jgi:hypothetical protein
MDIERELVDVGDSISVSLPPILVPIEELLRDPRDLQLLDTADELLSAGHPETAVVLAQTAVEVMADSALRVALRLSMPEGAFEPGPGF